MTKHEIKICQRCQTNFECKVGDVANCQCSSIIISEATNDYLAETNYDCLCKNCLSEINILVEKSQKIPFPKRPNQLIEDLHYYNENGFFVFTEFYHISRGFCCGNHCRHCAYGINLTH